MPIGFPDFPEDLAIKTIDTLFRSYKMSDELSEKSFEKSEYHYILPHVRRSFFEQNWRNAMEKIHCVNTMVESTRGGKHEYTVVSYGNLYLTASYLRERHLFPRASEFRKRYSFTPQLPFLFHDETIDKSDNGVYALLIHGPDLNYKNVGFAFWGIPDPGYKFFTSKLDLFAEFSEAVDRNKQAIIESPEPEVHQRAIEEAI